MKKFLLEFLKLILAESARNVNKDTDFMSEPNMFNDSAHDYELKKIMHGRDED